MAEEESMEVLRRAELQLLLDEKASVNTQDFRRRVPPPTTTPFNVQPVQSEPECLHLGNSSASAMDRMSAFLSELPFTTASIDGNKPCDEHTWTQSAQAAVDVSASESDLGAMSGVRNESSTVTAGSGIFAAGTVVHHEPPPKPSVACGNAQSSGRAPPAGRLPTASPPPVSRGSDLERTLADARRRAAAVMGGGLNVRADIGAGVGQSVGQSVGRRIGPSTSRAALTVDAAVGDDGDVKPRATPCHPPQGHHPQRPVPLRSDQQGSTCRPSLSSEPPAPPPSMAPQPPPESSAPARGAALGMASVTGVRPFSPGGLGAGPGPGRRGELDEWIEDLDSDVEELAAASIEQLTGSWPPPASMLR